MFQRVVPPVEVPDIDEMPYKYIVTGIMALAKEYGKMARIADDRSRPVDEYRVQTLVTDSESLVTVQPVYDQIPERIESIVITGPPGNISLQLGDRTWNMVVPATGVIVIAPVSLLLSRLDNRVLTPVATPGSVVTSPGVPASTVAIQNPTNAPVQAVLSGFTATAVIVNGVTVGVTNGTYYIPAYGAISVTYSVAGTWVWTSAQVSPAAGDYSLELMGWADERY